jgi:arginase family enzyme
VAGLFPHEALALIRSLAGMEFCGFDVVEVAPPYDNRAQTTAILAASIAYEFLALGALARRR